MPSVKLNDLVLSVFFFSIGSAYEKDNGPIGVIKSSDAPIDVLKSIFEEEV